MALLYIFIIMICRVIQAFFNKRSSNEIKNITMLVGYNSFKNAISAILGLVLLIIAGNGLKIDFLTVMIAAFSGLTLFFSGFCGIYAMKSGTVTLNSMFATAGMIIPIISGAVLFAKPVSHLQIVGLLMFFLSAYMLIGASKLVYSNFTFKTLLLLVGSMLANGSTMLAQQMFTQYVPDGDISAFSFLSFGIIAVLSGIFYKASNVSGKSENTKLTKPLIICGVMLAVAVFVINQLATSLTKMISPIILFTTINIGGTIISTLVAAIVYKEKITLKAVLGILVGIAALVIIKLFEV